MREQQAGEKIYFTYSPHTERIPIRIERSEILAKVFPSWIIVSEGGALNWSEK